MNAVGLPEIHEVSGDPGPAAPPPEPRSSRLQRILVGVLAVALLVAGFGLANQTRRVASLAQRAAALEAEIGRTQAVVAAYQLRFEQVRGEVLGLIAQVEALGSLVTREVSPAVGSGPAERSAGDPPSGE